MEGGRGARTRLSFTNCLIVRAPARGFVSWRVLNRPSTVTSGQLTTTTLQPCPAIGSSPTIAAPGAHAQRTGTLTAD